MSHAWGHCALKKTVCQVCILHISYYRLEKGHSYLFFRTIIFVFEEIPIRNTREGGELHRAESGSEQEPEFTEVVDAVSTLEYAVFVICHFG